MNRTLYSASHLSGSITLFNGTGYGITGVFVSHVPAGSQNLTIKKEGYLPERLLLKFPSRA